jgi:sulfate adenylyltransferase
MKGGGMVEPHGGKLVNLFPSEEIRKELARKAQFLKRVETTLRELCDAELIGLGAFSPLTGFLKKDDYESVVERCRLQNGVVWPLPVNLSIDKEFSKEIKEGEEVALSFQGEIYALFTVEELYSYDKKKEAQLVFKTTDSSHPGVQSLYSQGEVYAGGRITLFQTLLHSTYRGALSPAESREEFSRRSWEKIVGFQTRNPIHRAHEYLLKCALEMSDGLFIHPLVGCTKKDDIPSSVRLRCYEVLIEKYFPRERVVLSPLPAAMRYAGPREAVFHALVRKNYGCTHFIVGRDHAGVGNFYGPFEAQEIFSHFERDEIGITPLFFDHAFYCLRCQAMATTKTCPHTENERLVLSGSRVRELLREGEKLPSEFTRPEVAEILLSWAGEKIEA